MGKRKKVSRHAVEKKKSNPSYATSTKPCRKRGQVELTGDRPVTNGQGDLKKSLRGPASKKKKKTNLLARTV